MTAAEFARTIRNIIHHSIARRTLGAEGRTFNVMTDDGYIYKVTVDLVRSPDDTLTMTDAMKEA